MQFDEAMRLMRAEVRAAVRDELRGWLDELRGASSAPSDFLSVKAAASVVGVCPATIRAWLQRGLLARYGTARLPHIHRAELVQFMAGRRENAPERAHSIEEQAASLLARRISKP